MKQKNSCKYYDIITSLDKESPEPADAPAEAAVEPEEHKMNSTTGSAGFDWNKLEIDTLPNIQQLFDLFPYVMYYRGEVDIEGKKLREFKYSFPLGKDVWDTPGDSAFLAYFEADTMHLDRLVVKAESLNINSPFVLYASQPVTPRNFSKEDMDFQGVSCLKATDSEQGKLDHYVKRIVELAMPVVKSKI